MFQNPKLLSKKHFRFQIFRLRIFNW
jgi:hypothetical protein